MSRAQWNGTFRLHTPDSSDRAFGYCSCKQDTKERYWGQQFCQMERSILTWVPEAFHARFPVSETTHETKVAREKKNLWYPGWGHFGPVDQNDQMYVPTEVSRILGWMESAPDVLLHLALSWLKILETPMHFPLLHTVTLQMRRGIFQSVSRFLSEIVDSTLWTFYWPVFHRLRSKVFKSEVWTCALCFFR